MTSQIIPVEPFDCVVFGGTGDLAERKLLPALYHRQIEGQFTEPTRIIAASRSEMSDDAYRMFAKTALETFLKPGELVEDELNKFLARLFYRRIDAMSDSGWDDLAGLLNEAPERIRAYYLAVSPNLFGEIANRLKTAGLVTPKARIIVEKPIGRDLASAKTLNDTIGAVFAENRIFRIDHYLGKETVQNLMALRFANSLYEPLWNSTHIDRNFNMVDVG